MAGRLFGTKARFAVEVGEFYDDSHQLRRVDVWAADRWLTCEDNQAFVPHFTGMLSRAVGSLLAEPHTANMARPYVDLAPAENHRRLEIESLIDGLRVMNAYSFMDWGSTADNVCTHLFRENGVAFLTFSFWREQHHDPSEVGQVFVAELPEWELITVLHEAAWALMWDWAGRSTGQK